MNALVPPSFTAAAITSPSPMAATNCSDDCFLLHLFKERSHMSIIILRLPLSLVLVVFSGLTILVTRRSTRLLERPSATLVTNLGVTGGIIGGVIFILTVVNLVMAQALAMAMSLRAVVLLGALLPRILHIVTTLTLTCLTLDRYLALCKPLRYSALLTDTHCFLLVALSWVIPVVVLGVPCLWKVLSTPCADIRPFLVIYLLLFTFAITAIVTMYCLIAREFRRLGASTIRGQELVEVRRRTAKELMVVVMVNLLLATPDVMTKLYLLSCPKKLNILYYVPPILLLVHLICFYPLYAWKNLDFRRGMLETCTSFRKSFGSGIRRISRMCCSVSFTQRSFARVSFASASSSMRSPGAVSIASPTTTTTTTTTATTTATTSSSSSTSSSPSSASSITSSAAASAGENNVMFFP